MVLQTVQTLQTKVFESESGTPTSEDETLLDFNRLTFLTDTCTGIGELPCLSGHTRCFNISSLGRYDLDRYGHLHPCRNGAHLIGSNVFLCNGWYKCLHSYCIPVDRICDGTKDCPLGDDELSCQSENELLDCPGFFRCKGGRCIHQNQVCDGVPHCGVNGDDEIGCKEQLCVEKCICTWQWITCAKADLSKLNRGVKYVSVMLNGRIFPVVTNHMVLVLDLSNNLFTVISTGYFNGVTNVAIIGLSNNRITVIETLGFSNLRNLRQISLNKNPLKLLEDKSFNNLPRLLSLNFSGLPVEAVKQFTFKALTNLIHIDMSHGQIRSLNISLLTQIGKNSHLNIRDNPIMYIYEAGLGTNYVWTVETDNEYVCCLVANDRCTGPPKDRCFSDSISIDSPTLLSITIPIFVIHVNSTQIWTKKAPPRYSNVCVKVSYLCQWFNGWVT